MKEELLFVTNTADEWDEGFPYVLELAQTLKAGIAVLMVIGKQSKNTFDEMMVAVTLAEGGVPEMAREHLLFWQEKRIKAAAAENVQGLAERCKGIAIDFTCEVRVGDIIFLVQEILKKRHAISMVLLSPNLSKVLDIRKMTKNVNKPIVIITRQGREE